MSCGQVARAFLRTVLRPFAMCAHERYALLRVVRQKFARKTCRGHIFRSKVPSKRRSRKAHSDWSAYRQTVSFPPAFRSKAHHSKQEYTRVVRQKFARKTCRGHTFRSKVPSKRRSRKAHSDWSAYRQTVSFPPAFRSKAHHSKQEYTRVVRQKGLEPPTYCLEGSCSIRMSYWRVWSE